MRRLFPLLCAAGLAVAPSPAGADNPPTVETFEWSAMTSRGRLGVMVVGITPELRKHFGAAEDRGVLVARVEPRSDAATAGVQVGDVIARVRGVTVDSAADVLSALAQARQGDAVAIDVIRDRRPLTLKATMTTAPLPADARPPWLDGWFDDMRRRFQQPSWFEELLRPWNERGPARGGDRSKQT